MKTADELLADYILDAYRKEHSHYATREPMNHLADCDEVTITHPVGEDGVYGCDTGCSYYRLSANLTCPHGESEEYEYGDFGEIGDIIAELEAGAREHAAFYANMGLQQP